MKKVTLSYGNAEEVTMNENGLQNQEPGRSSQAPTLASLLCKLWMEEETRLMVLRDPVGCICCKFTIEILCRLKHT